MAGYATLLALGYSRGELTCAVIVQAVLLGSSGLVLGSLAFWAASYSADRSQVPLAMTIPVAAGLAVTELVACLLSSIISIRYLFRIDPVHARHRELGRAVAGARDGRGGATVRP